MQLSKKLEPWAEAHVFYNMYDYAPCGKCSYLEKEEYSWRKRMLHQTPNGHLLQNNSLFRDLKNSKKFYLNHTTFNLNKILKSGILYSSGGCLIGSIYCTPLTKTSSGLRLHNLSQYIYRKEAPKTTQNNGLENKILDSLIIEIELGSNERNNLIGIDYLRLGKVHYSIYKDLEYLLSIKERAELEHITLRRIKNSCDFLSLTNNYFFNKKSVDETRFMQAFIKTIDQIPFLGYLYFEAVSEFLMLHQNCQYAKKYIDLDEFYNPGYKDLMFSLRPKLLENFTLKDFKPSVDYIYNFIIKHKLICNLDKNYLIQYLANRLIFLTNARLFNNLNIPVTWHTLTWDFDNIVDVFKPLIGHLIHRELRSFGRYPDFYFYFDQLKALEVWNYWNQMNIAIPFNGVIPKGEIGVNPGYANLKYRIYQGKITDNNGFDFIEPIRELKLKIVPRLIDLKFTFMRNKN